jgi:hypothetical protein
MIFKTDSKHYEPHDGGGTQIGIDDDSTKDVHHTIHHVLNDRIMLAVCKISTLRKCHELEGCYPHRAIHVSPKRHWVL